MNRGIYLAPLTSLQNRAARRRDVDRRRNARTAEARRVKKILRKSQSAEQVRSFDPTCPASSIATATRLSNLYGVSLTSKLARKGAGDRRQSRYWKTSGHDGSGLGTAQEGKRRESKRDGATRKHTRELLRSALEKADEVAARLTLEASAGVKAFDGPPLTSGDVKDLFLRNFRVRLSTSEAEALIMNFKNMKGKRPPERVARITIEHGAFLQALRRLRRELPKRQQRNIIPPIRTRRVPHPRGGGESESPLMPTRAALPLANMHGDHPGAVDQGHDLQSLHIDDVVRALAKVDRAASSYDPRRTESLRHADLSRAYTPRTFGGVLLARFDVRVDALEQNELVSLLQDEEGRVDVERFRTYFLGLVEDKQSRKTCVGQDDTQLPRIFRKSGEGQIQPKLLKAGGQQGRGGGTSTMQSWSNNHMGRTSSLTNTAAEATKSTTRNTIRREGDQPTTLIKH